MKVQTTIKLGVASFAVLAGTVFIGGSSASASSSWKHDSGQKTSSHKKTYAKKTYHNKTSTSYGGRGAGSSSHSSWSWEGLKAYNKTNGEGLAWRDGMYHAKVGTNVVFHAGWINANAHHYKMTMKDMDTGRYVFSKSMVSNNSAHNPRQDRSLGWTVYKPASYMMQVDAYAEDGTWLGAHHEMVHVTR